jgi:transcription elongation GreA/GreB family factor
LKEGTEDNTLILAELKEIEREINKERSEGDRERKIEERKARGTKEPQEWRRAEILLQKALLIG